MAGGAGQLYYLPGVAAELVYPAKAVALPTCKMLGQLHIRLIHINRFISIPEKTFKPYQPLPENFHFLDF